jgi:hypothetical protein
MPTYVAECATCGEQQDFIRKVADRDDTPLHCGTAMNRLGSWAVAPQVGAMSWTGHQGLMVNGKWAESGTDYKRIMKQDRLLSGSEGAREAEIQAKNKEERISKVRRQAVADAVHQHMK